MFTVFIGVNHFCCLGSDEDDIDLFDSDAGEGSNDEEEQEEDDDEDAERSLYQYYDDFFDPVPSSVTKTPSVDEPLSLHQKKQEKVGYYNVSSFYYCIARKFNGVKFG